MKIQKCVEKISVQTNFLSLSKINSLLSNKNRHRISNSIFEKSTKFWFQCIGFGSSEILSSGSKINKDFVSKLSGHPLIEWILKNSSTIIGTVCVVHLSKNWMQLFKYSFSILIDKNHSMIVLKRGVDHTRNCDH